jgi:DNA helicase-2/ATP-dependent DNA helicase PcrA
VRPGGAGTGKTRTITHRIAHLVGAGHVAAGQVLAVTFTQRAAGELRGRLRSLDAEAQTGAGVGAVQALTFHAAARRQLRYFWPRVIGAAGSCSTGSSPSSRRPPPGPDPGIHRRCA